MVEITYKHLQNGDIVFYSRNKAYCDYYVTLDFTILSNLDCTTFLPFHESVPPGKTQIFKLVSRDPTRATQFVYDYNSVKGCGECKIDTNFIYSLPVKVDKDVDVSGIYQESKDNIRNYDYDKYIISFDIAESDTIYAIRSGYVSDLSAYKYSIN